MSNDSKTAIFKSKGGSDIEIHQFKVWQNSAIWPGRDPIVIRPCQYHYTTNISIKRTKIHPKMTGEVIKNHKDPLYITYR
jgi:hypothetical protein